MTSTLDFQQMSIDQVVAAFTTRYTREQIAAACRKWGSQLWLPSAWGIDGAKLLWALSGCESSFGANCAPRHEMAYCTGGYSTNPEVRSLTAKYGHAAHCSFGPWQTLLVNVEKYDSVGKLLVASEVSPDEMMDCDQACQRAAEFINNCILRREGARTVGEIADAYNSGDWRDRIVPVPYIAMCEKYYDAAAADMPPVAA